MTRITVNDILEAAQETTAFTIGEIIGTYRWRPLIRIRQACYFLAREAGYSYPQIGSRMGGKDHSTVIYGARQCENIMPRDPAFEMTVNRIRLRAVWIADRRRLQLGRAATSNVTVRFSL